MGYSKQHTIANNEGNRKPFFFVKVFVEYFSGKKSLIMNVIVLCLTLTILASSSNATRQHARQLVAPPKENRVGEINLPFEDNPEIILDNRIEDIENEVEDEGFIDSIFGDGAQSRIVEKASDWLVDRASENPGCVERFVCETLNGIPYMLMTLTNAAVSFMVADMFDKSIDIKELTRAARYGNCGILSHDEMRLFGQPIANCGRLSWHFRRISQSNFQLQ